MLLREHHLVIVLFLSRDYCSHRVVRVFMCFFLCREFFLVQPRSLVMVCHLVRHDIDKVS